MIFVFSQASIDVVSRGSSEVHDRDVVVSDGSANHVSCPWALGAWCRRSDFSWRMWNETKASSLDTSTQIQNESRLPFNFL